MQTQNNTPEKHETILKQALNQAPAKGLPDNFTDRLMARIEKRVAARQVLSIFLMKSAIAVALIIFISGILFFPAFEQFLRTITGLTRYWQPITYVAIIVLFTLLFDQLLLPYLLRTYLHKKH